MIPLVQWYDNLWKYFYVQQEPGETIFRFCATDAEGAKGCTMDLEMVWEAKPFHWSVQMDDATPACVDGRVPFSYTVTFWPQYNGYDIAAALSSGGGAAEDPSARRVENLSDGIYRVSGALTRIGTGGTVRETLSVTDYWGDTASSGNQDETPTFSPRLGSCDRAAMIGGTAGGE